MKALDRKTVEKIYDIMDGLDVDTLNNSDDYVMNCFSVFDHWLTEEEANEQIYFYAQALEEGAIEKVKKYYEYHDRILNFYLDLYNKANVYGLLSSEHGPSAIIIFDNIEEYRSHVLLSVREQLFLKLVLPEYSAVIMGNFDFRHLLYTMKSKPESLSELTEIIKTNGLFVL